MLISVNLRWVILTYYFLQVTEGWCEIPTCAPAPTPTPTPTPGPSSGNSVQIAILSFMVVNLICVGLYVSYKFGLYNFLAGYIRIRRAGNGDGDGDGDGDDGANQGDGNNGDGDELPPIVRNSPATSSDQSPAIMQATNE